MNKQILVCLICILFILPVVTAEIQSLPIQKQGSCVNLEQTCSNCSYVNVDSVIYPNSTKWFIDSAMTNEGYGYTYEFCDTNTSGKYIVTTCGDPSGTITCVNYDFDVTFNGNTESNSTLSVFIWILFILAVLGLVYTCFLTVAKIATTSETIYDVLLSWGFYILMIVVNYLGGNYLAKPFIENLSSTFTTITVWTNAILPVVALMITMVAKSLMKRNVMSIQEVGGFRYG